MLFASFKNITEPSTKNTPTDEPVDCAQSDANAHNPHKLVRPSITKKVDFCTNRAFGSLSRLGGLPLLDNKPSGGSTDFFFLHTDVSESIVSNLWAAPGSSATAINYKFFHFTEGRGLALFLPIAL